MSNPIIYTPCYNPGQELLNTLQSVQGMPCIVSDNHSEKPDSLEILNQVPAFAQVIRQPQNLGRTGNWDFCIQHFAQNEQNLDWMKWLFCGDILLPNAKAVLENASRAYPEARLIVTPFYLVKPSGRELISFFPETRLFPPNAAMYTAAETEGWMGMTVALYIHREAVQQHPHFMENLPFAADFEFCLQIAKQYPVLYWNEPVAECHLSSRKYLVSAGRSPEATLEVALVRMKAARHYLAQSSDEQGFQKLVFQIEKDTAKAMVRRAIARKTENSALFPLLYPLRNILK